VKIIAHRANIGGPNQTTENTKEQILRAIAAGYECEIDIWSISDKLYLGHDKPGEEVSDSFLALHRDSLWCHAKNEEAIFRLASDKYLNLFWHNTDGFTITSKGYIWCLPSKKVYVKGINLLPETTGLSKEDLTMVLGVCTDYPEKYK
jgi:hypothetical protein